MPVINPPRTEDHGPVLEATEARQAFKGRHMLAVLVVSMALIVVLFGGLYLMRAPALSGPGPQSAAAGSPAQSFNAPPSQPRATDTGQPPH